MLLSIKLKTTLSRSKFSTLEKDVIEYGAQWIHGKNPIYNLGKSLGILDESTKSLSLFYLKK